MLAGDYNVAPTEIDIYPTTSWDDDALVQPQSRAAYARLAQAGLDRRPARAASAMSASTRSGTTCAIAGSATPACASITCCSARRLPLVSKRPASIARCAASPVPAIMRRCGSNLPRRNRARAVAASRLPRPRPWGHGHAGSVRVNGQRITCRRQAARRPRCRSLQCVSGLKATMSARNAGARRPRIVPSPRNSAGSVEA